MMAEQSAQRRKIHPKKFAMWIAIGSIIMMFGGLTSGYIVRKSQGNWQSFNLPVEFYYSTAAIVLSSITIIMAVRSFKQRQMQLHRSMVTLTLFLGLGFTLLQYLGFKDLYEQLKWNNNVSFQYLIVIVLTHALHILGGVAALFILFFQTFSRKVKNYNTTAIEIVSTYWHFVDILWLYLFIFFIINR